MAFWGIKLEPGKSFIHRFDKARGRLHISQATLDIDCEAVEMSAVRCIVGAKNPILLCAFLPSKKLSCPLDLEFEEEDDVVFSVIGPRSVYLTGFYIGEICGDVVIEKNKVEVGGNPAKKEVEEGSSHGKKRKSHTTVQDAGSKRSKVSEQRKDYPVPSIKTVYEKGGKSKKAYEFEPEVANIDNRDQEHLEDDSKEKQPNEKVSEQPKDSSVQSTEIVHEKIRKSKKAYVSKPKVAKTDNIGKQPVQDCDSNASSEGEENKGLIVETKGEKAEEVPLDVRTFTNGMVIEELKFADTHDGKVALPGTKVTVNYVGKLKTDGELFDSTDDGAPYQFRLGVGKVIKGWDLGVSGMRVGDKRRITIPPALGYGSEGAPGKYRKVPPNASLVYEIEVVDVR